ncbi:MAG: c-type cytochrome [Cyclobacteriaceae bacterium]
MMNLFYPLMLIFLISSCSQPEKKLQRKRTTKSAITVMRSNDCFGCHSIEDYTGVPSYRMIAERYKNNYQTISELTEKVLEGGGGKWGNAQMVKHPLLKPKDARNIVKWVLSLDADSVTSKLKPQNTVVYADTLHPYKMDIYEADQKIFSGSMDEINLMGNEHIKPNRRVIINGTISIKERGKHFFYLRKSGIGKMKKGPSMVISDRPDDNEIMLELDPGNYPFEIEYTARSESDTLALFWLPEGRDYYEVMR